MYTYIVLLVQLHREMFFQMCILYGQCTSPHWNIYAVKALQVPIVGYLVLPTACALVNQPIHNQVIRLRLMFMLFHELFMAHFMNTTIHVFISMQGQPFLSKVMEHPRLREYIQVHVLSATADKTCSR